MEKANDPVTVELQNDLSELKLARITGLNEAVSVQLAMQSLFAHEARRIEAKLGPDDERSKKLTTRSQFNAQALRAMELELQLTRIDAPKVEAEGALVHGRVVDQDDLGIDRLIVCLVDLSGARLDINEATSDDSGYFAISMDSETLARVIKSSPKGVFPAVSTPRGRSIYRQSKPLTLTHGTRLLLEIRLNRTDLTAAPATDTRIAVPDVVGKPEREALATLKNAGLNPTQSETKVSDQVGIVLDQKPAAGSNVVPGTSITLTVGIAETNTVAVPNLVGANLRTAKAKLRAAELNLGTVSGPSPTDLSIIEKQEPEAEAQVPKGTPVNLIVRTAERRARKRRGN